MNDWFISPRDPGGATVPRIFCFPHAGGSPRAFLDWQADLDGEAEIVAICRPGREHRADEPAPTIGELIEGSTDAIASLVARDGRPYCLFGHSLGALVAFEVCRRLSVSGGVAPQHFVASGCSAPSLLPSARVRRIATLTGAEFAEAIGFFGGLAPEVIAEPELRDLLLPGLIADFRMAVGYEYQQRPPLPVPATIVVGRDDPHVTDEVVAPWDQEFTWPPDRHWVDGGHFYFDSNRGAITAILREMVRADQHAELI
jgi:surfactin synthase thioesterase subunit